MEGDFLQPRQKAPRMNCLTDVDDLSTFATVLRKGDEEKAKLKREKSEFAKIQFEEAKKDCEFEREERRREREDAQRLELERLNFILQTIWKPE